MSAIQPHLGKYRPEIDGLRAVAVLSVVVFHINPHCLPGGFAGVDIFFVISGYLITSILAEELESGRFSLTAFYERRVRRILPALWAMLALCLPISWWLMLPSDAAAMAKSALWSTLAMANVYFWREVNTDYFAPQSAQMPFLHLWSLGVEEQFYLLWPLLLLVVWIGSPRQARLISAGIAVLLAVLAVGIGEALLAGEQLKFAYYMLPARMGELTTGAALALAWPRLSVSIKAWTPRRRSTATALLAGLGWALLTWSFLALDESQPFPGLLVLVPTIGTLLLLTASLLWSASPWLSPLRWRAANWLGRSSYSAYLWHWPVLAWWRYLAGEPGWIAGLGLFVLILVLAELSRRFVEDPVRRSKTSPRMLFVWVGLVPALILGAMAYSIARADRLGLWQLSSETQEAVRQAELAARPAHREPWVCQRHVLDEQALSDPLCEFGAAGGKGGALLMGDSHAAQFAAFFRVVAQAQGVRVRSVALGSCAPLAGPLKGLVSAERLPACEAGVPRILAMAERYPLLIIGGAWASYERNDARVWGRLETQLGEMTRRGQTVWLLPRVPELRGYDAACNAKRARSGTWLPCADFVNVSRAADATNSRLAALAQKVPGVRFLPLTASLCAGPRCDVRLPSGEMLYADASHLSVPGAKHLAVDLDRRGELPDLLAAMVAARPSP